MTRLLPFVILILLVLGFLIGLPLLIQPDSHRAELAQYLSTRLHHKIVIGKLDATFVPPLLHLNDVSVMGAGDETPLLHIDRIDVLPEWQSLLHRQVAPQEITLNHWVLQVQRRADSTWDWDEWLSPVTGGVESAHWPIQSVTLHSGECHWSDRFAAKPQEAILQSIEGKIETSAQKTKLTGTLNGLGPSIVIGFEGQGHFTVSGDWAGDLRLTDGSRQWALHVAEQNHVLDAKGQSAEWNAAQFWAVLSFYARWKSASLTTSAPLVKEWKNHFTWSASSMTFYESGMLGGGLAELKGEQMAVEDHSTLALALSLHDVPVEALSEVMDEPLPISGKLTTMTRLEMAVASQPWASLSSAGSVEVKAGHFRFPSTALKSLSKAHTMNYMTAKFPGFIQKGLSFDRLHVQWEARNGLVTVKEARLDAGNLDASLSGHLDGTRRGIDAYTRLQISEADPTLLGELPSHYVNGSTIQPIFGHIQGNWTDWTVRAISSSNIPYAYQSRLKIN